MVSPKARATVHVQSNFEFNGSLTMRNPISSQVDYFGHKTPGKFDQTTIFENSTE